MFVLLGDRLQLAIFSIPTQADWQYTIILLAVYSFISLSIGFGTAFLNFGFSFSWQKSCKIIATSLIAPALLEELFFRALLLPHPIENVTIQTEAISIIISLFLFVIYHPLNALTFFPVGSKTFFAPIFLYLATLLGVICTLAYLTSGCIWMSVIIHWLTVIIWLLCLGGAEKLSIVDN